MLRLLTAAEIEIIGARVHFERAAMGMLQTADYLPIDAAVARLESAWTAAVRQNPSEFPTCAFRGERLHAPPPESIRQYYPEAKRDGWTERVSFDIQGATDGETSVLFLTRIKNIDAPASIEPCSPRLFGLDPLDLNLISRRSLDIHLVNAIADATPSLLSQMQARDIASVVPHSKRSAGSRKI